MKRLDIGRKIRRNKKELYLPVKSQNNSSWKGPGKVSSLTLLLRAGATLNSD